MDPYSIELCLFCSCMWILDVHCLPEFKLSKGSTIANHTQPCTSSLDKCCLTPSLMPSKQHDVEPTFEIKVDWNGLLMWCSIARPAMCGAAHEDTTAMSATTAWWVGLSDQQWVGDGAKPACWRFFICQALCHLLLLGFSEFTLLGVSSSLQLGDFAIKLH